jgi:hypothetical protein
LSLICWLPIKHRKTKRYTAREIIDCRLPSKYIYFLNRSLFMKTAISKT